MCKYYVTNSYVLRCVITMVRGYLSVVLCNYHVTRILFVVQCNYHVTRLLFVVLCNCHVTIIYPLCCVIATLPGCICHAATISVITISQSTFLARMEYMTSR